MALILLIEDDAAERASISQMLGAADHEVETLPDGRRALERCRARSFDVVITDLIMPEQEGLETIRRLRRAGVTVPIIAISDEGHHAHGSHYLRTARLLGADETFIKPLNADQLHACLRTWTPHDGASEAAASTRSRAIPKRRLPRMGSSPERGTLSREERPPRRTHRRPPQQRES